MEQNLKKYKKWNRFAVYLTLTQHCQSLSVCSVTQRVRLSAAQLTEPARLLCPRNFPGKNTGVVLLPFPTAGDLPNPGIKLASLTSPALAGIFFTTSATWEAPISYTSILKISILKNIPLQNEKASHRLQKFSIHIYIILIYRTYIRRMSANNYNKTKRPFQTGS